MRTGVLRGQGLERGWQASRSSMFASGATPAGTGSLPFLRLAVTILAGVPVLAGAPASAKPTRGQIASVVLVSASVPRPASQQDGKGGSG